jgi:hypothetical protein
MAGTTNRGKKLMLEYAFSRVTTPTNFYLYLLTSSATITDDTNTFSEVSANQITIGNGYTGGFSLTAGSTDFDASAEDDSSNYGNIQIKDIVWTASGGTIPASGDGARYVLMTDDNVVEADREVIAFWDLVSDRSVSDTQSLTVQDLEIRGTES